MSFMIGDVEIKGKVILAPMAGITSFSYRKFMQPFGCALTYSEMISDCALIQGNHETKKLFASDGKSDRPLALQIFGGNEETLLEALDILNKYTSNYDILDLNLACPVPKVTKNNGGSSWLKDQNKLFDMVSKIVKASSKPVSCKIRLGFDDINVEDTVKTLERAGVKFIAIHARTKKQLYSGEPNFKALENIHNIISIPWCVSGNIFTVKDALEALKITKCDAIMVARGAEGNPELISNINHALNNEPYDEKKDFLKQCNYLETYITYMFQEFEEITCVRILRGILPHFFDGTTGTKQLKNELCSNTNSKQDIFNIINKYKVLYFNRDDNHS